MLEFQMPQITHEEVSATEGVFVVEPLERGFGYTFGNSLPRAPVVARGRRGHQCPH